MALMKQLPAALTQIFVQQQRKKCMQTVLLTYFSPLQHSSELGSPPGPHSEAAVPQLSIRHIKLFANLFYLKLWDGHMIAR